MLITLNDVYNSRIPSSAGLCAPDSRLTAWINEAQMRLLTKGIWYGTYGKYRIAAYNSILALPPQLATIEAVAVNHVPVPIHDTWFEFLENGFGTRSPSTLGSAGGSAIGGTPGVCGIPEADFRGSFPTFRDLTLNSNPKKVVVVCDLAADVAAAIKMTVLGYDQNGNWIRTLQGAVYADGEVISLAQSPGTTSVNTFSSITGIQFSAQRSGQCWLYELDTVTNVQTLTGWYQWFETNPSYGRWFFPGIPGPQTGCTPPANAAQNWTQTEILSPAQPCNPCLVEVVGKKAFIPVALPGDYLIIGNIPALKLEIQSIKKQEDAVSAADMNEARMFETQAIMELDSELDHYLGSGRRMGMNIQGPMLADGCAIPTLI